MLRGGQKRDQKMRKKKSKLTFPVMEEHLTSSSAQKA